MKRVYWRPRAVSRTALLLIAALSLGGLLLVEYQRQSVQQPFYTEKLDAASLAEKCMHEIRKHGWNCDQRSIARQIPTSRA